MKIMDCDESHNSHDGKYKSYNKQGSGLYEILYIQES
jgi:hypothetical protein